MSGDSGDAIMYGLPARCLYTAVIISSSSNAIKQEKKSGTVIAVVWWRCSWWSPAWGGRGSNAWTRAHKQDHRLTVNPGA